VRRIDRRRRDRWVHHLQVIGASFAAGALTAGLLVMRQEPSPPASTEDVAVTESAAEIAALQAGTAIVADPEPAHDPAEPRGAERPGEQSPRPTATTGSVPHSNAVETLRRRDLEIPVAGIDEDDLRDTFADARGGTRAHEAIDIMAPRSTPVRAVEDGTIAKLFSSKAGGLTIYMFEPSGTFCYYYAHLDRYAEGLKEGQAIRRGQVIGFVGTTGWSTGCHLHFTVMENGSPVDPMNWL